MNELTKKYVCIITILFIICSGVNIYANEQTNKQDLKLTDGKLYYEQHGTLKYEGQLLNGVPHGYGKFYAWDGIFGAVLRYKGEFKNGKLEGYGKYYGHDEKLLYIGSWKNDKRHGFGADLYYGILKYVGEFENGKKEGLGVEYRKWGLFSREVITQGGQVTMVITKNKDKVITPLPTKLGTIKNYGYPPNQEDKVGEIVIEEELKKIISSGYSSSNLLDKLKYIGDLKDSVEGTKVEEGYGELYNLDGDLIYAGGFKEGKMEGFGATFLDNRLSYIGEFKEWHKEGLGAIFAPRSQGNLGVGAEVYFEKTDEGRKRHYVARRSEDTLEAVKKYPVNVDFIKHGHKDIANYTLNKKQLKDMVEDYYSKWKDEFKRYFEKYLEKKSKEVRTTA